MKKQPKGFTLLELLVTVALVALLAAYAVPSFRNTMQNNQLVACANKLVTAVQFARTEAVATRNSVLVSDAGNNDFRSIRVGLDPDGDNFVDDDDLLQVLECEGNGLTIVEQNLNASFLSFGPTGFRADGQGRLSFLTCNEVGNGRLMTVSISGAISSAEAPIGTC